MLFLKVIISIKKYFSHNILIYYLHVREGYLGTHSLRKGSATYASFCGVSRNFVNKRGRWRMRKAIVDTYIDITLPCPDACKAAVLNGPGGACKYKLKSTNVIDKTFYCKIL